MKWTDSKAIRYVLLSWFGGVLLQFVPMLQSHRIDWWALGAQSVSALAAIIIRMAQSDVEAPFAILNRNNPPAGT